MIPKIHDRGTAAGWLLRYLFNPRPGGEHRNPRIVASWAYATMGDLTELQPPSTTAGRYSLQRLTNLLEQPIRAGRNPPALPVWHCSVHNHPDDPTLSDQQWEHIATEITAAVGLAPHDDDDAVRWIAIRHADNHIHIVATLVRQDRRTAWAWNDKINVQATCRDLEKHYGLHQVGLDRRAARWPTPDELNKANRQHRPEVPRDRLHREVRAAAEATTNQQDFLHHLHTAGLLIRLRNSSTSPGTAIGYAVALPDHHTAAGDTSWYSGTQLASDLTLPKLRRRWR